MRHFTADGPVPHRIRVETDGHELLALDPDRGAVHRISAVDVAELRAGRWEPYEQALAPEVLDAVLAAVGRPRWDRRRILTASGALASAGITSLLLPSAARAASLFGVAFGTGYSTGPITFVPTDGSASVSYGSSYLTWTVPANVSEVQVVAWSTDGTRAGTLATASPYTGTPGRGVYAVGSFDVTPGSDLVIAFSSASMWGQSADRGGAGGQAAGVGDLSGGSIGDWLIVAGGGGGAGNAGYSASLSRYLTGDYLGGDGGDAGTGGDAGSGTAGSGTDAAGTTAGAAGATVSAAGAGSTGSSEATDGGPGSGPSGPTNDSRSTDLGGGGTTFSGASSGGAGGGGLYGGGGGGSGGNGYAAGGGGGGSSYVNTAKRTDGTQSRIQTFSRAGTAFARIDLYY